MEKPEGGWKQGTFYLVKVAWRGDNPIHHAIFYSGFLKNGEPGSYSKIMNPMYDREVGELYYFEVVRELISEEEWSSATKKLVLPKDKS